jgi:hypothetical protein
MTLNKHENGEISFHKDLKSYQFKADLQSNMLRQKVILISLGSKNHLILGNINHSMLCANDEDYLLNFYRFDIRGKDSIFSFKKHNEKNSIMFILLYLNPS